VEGGLDIGEVGPFLFGRLVVGYGTWGGGGERALLDGEYFTLMLSPLFVVLKRLLRFLVHPNLGDVSQVAIPDGITRHAIGSSTPKTSPREWVCWCWRPKTPSSFWRSSSPCSSPHHHRGGCSVQKVLGWLPENGYVLLQFDLDLFL
jgi:hypothetical protein